MNDDRLTGCSDEISNIQRTDAEVVTMETASKEDDDDDDDDEIEDGELVSSSASESELEPEEPVAEKGKSCSSLSTELSSETL